ncbi:MAG: hypothetical protein H6709_17455 [Kofleriaceae bacterium]|nr:hypothetical protein [Myxococcales bacterium]MCB9564446.1 hypothetical protein [Kofleriaceae bacterium]MCB9573870.1 hypothetical protein [Kofleriaceae bacterium]
MAPDPSPGVGPRARRSIVAAIVPVVLVAAAARPARADGTASVDITLNQAGQDLAAELGISGADLEMKLSTGLRKGLALLDIDDFLRDFANASSFSNRGLGVDYATNSDRLVLGVAANLAVSAEIGDGTPSAGVAPNVTIMGGLNLASWQHPAWTVFGNLFHRGGGSGQLDGSISSLGLHVQRKFFHPTRGAKGLVAQWGGLDLTAGVELARWSFGIGDELGTDYTIEAGAQSRTIAATATGTFDLHTLTVTAPVELTTSLRVLYVASVYTGVGFDAQGGRSRVDAGLTGTLTAANGAAAPTTIGSLALQATGRQRPSIGGVHGLLGVQANLWKLKVFTQVSYQPATTASLAFGLRVDL